MTADHVNEPVIPAPDVQDDPIEAPAAVEDIPTDIPADTGAEPAEDAHEGFSGGPSDPSMLTLYADHVACSVWTGEERPELKLSSHGRKVHSLGRSVPAIEGLVAGTGLSPLIACSVDTGDRGLLSAFVERWHRETSSFHLPVGELTITLDDVSSLLHLSVIGDLHAFEPLHVDDAVQMLVDLLMSATNVHVVYLEALRDLNMTERYAWGVAALVHMYDQLNDASMSHNRQLGGYITLLQHFPSVADSTADQEYDEDSPRACRWITTKKIMKSIRTPAYRERLDRLRIPDVCWIPYGEHREVRDFHTIPAPPVDLWVSYDDIHDKWMHYEDHIVPAAPSRPSGPADEYPSSTFAEEPKHVVEVCDDIAERLERHLSLGVVTPGSSTHEVIEECLKLARSMTHDHLVYVRSRRRRRTDQA
ncbi:Protein MAIN-LIKE 1 [Glycine max]|nr:Protein MAIN-LIKE 1 [Glycine max]